MAYPHGEAIAIEFNTLGQQWRTMANGGEWRNRLWRPVLWPIELHSYEAFAGACRRGCKCPTGGRDASPQVPGPHRSGRSSESSASKKPTPGRPGIGHQKNRKPRTSAHCGFTNRPTRPAAPLAWPLSLAWNSGSVRPGGSSFGSRSVAMIMKV
jgi:hypothetical protein